MSRVPARLGSAERHVLLCMTRLHNPVITWSRRDGSALYENRALTEELCQLLVRRGFLDETLEDGHIIYQVNKAGNEAALKLRTALDGFTGSTGR